MKLLNKNQVETLVKNNQLFPQNSTLIITDILSELDASEGLVNQIYRISDGTTSVILKQVLPFALAIKKATGIDHPMDPERIYLEAKALTFLNTFWDKGAPSVYKIDPEQGVLIMEDLTHLRNLRFELPKGIQYPYFGLEMGALLAGLRYYTSELYLSKDEKEKFDELFDNTPHRINMTNMILGPESPLFRSEIFEPAAHETQKQANTDPAITEAVERMRSYLINSKECFSHMDLHIGNILIDEKEARMIDSEFSGIGTSFMDLGRLASSFLINYFAWLYDDRKSEKRLEMLSYDLQVLYDLFESYRLTLNRLYPEDAASVYRSVFKDSLRLLVLSLILRLQDNIALSYDISLIRSKEKLGAMQQRAFELLINTFHHVDSYNGIKDFIDEIIQMTKDLY